MRTDPMTGDEQAILFNRILKNQITIMGAIHAHTNKVISNVDIPTAIQETKDVKRIVQYVDEWGT